MADSNPKINGNNANGGKPQQRPAYPKKPVVPKKEVRILMLHGMSFSNFSPPPKLPG